MGLLMSIADTSESVMGARAHPPGVRIWIRAIGQQKAKLRATDGIRFSSECLAPHRTRPKNSSQLDAEIESAVCISTR
jgi:hypothetical protein